MSNDLGIEKKAVCNRKGCTGIIQEYDKRDCSCHINPPCSACTERRGYCEECGWEEAEDQHFNGFVGSKDSTGEVTWTRRPLDSSKIDWHAKSHTASSMIKEGVYPEGATRGEVLKEVLGTFGGRFESFGGGHFKYIAYTD